MVDPAFALLVFFAVVVLLVLAWWPRRGLVPRILALARMSERVRIEDALKHLYNAEYAGRIRSVEGLAGALEVRRARATRLVALLENRGLAHVRDAQVMLTEEGRRTRSGSCAPIGSGSATWRIARACGGAVARGGGAQ